MNIIGNGVDIIENKRIKNSLKIKGFINRVFTKEEINQSKKTNYKVNFFAKRFAAKEAFAKAIGSGIRNNVSFKDINVKNNKNGQPSISVSKNIEKFLRKAFKINKCKIYLSLSDEKKYSIAFVIINKIK